MLNKTTEITRARRLAMAAVTIILAGAAQVGCHAEPEPVAPAQPAAPAAAADPPPADGAQAEGQDDANIEDFYEPLASYGTWVDVESYGRVWQPSEDVANDDFTPYASDGSWANNEDGDYVFTSKYDTEFGWATYHYGRWVHDAGTTWAPAWVDWRYGGGYVGWAPLGPAGYVVAENRWFFTEERYFGAPNVYVYRLGGDRMHVAYMAASPIVEVRGRGRWEAGPPAGGLRAAGVAMRTSRGRAPARGYVKAQAHAVTTRAAARGPRPAVAARTVKNSRTPHRDAPAPAPAPAHHDTTAPAHHEAPGHQSAPPPHEAAKPAAAPAPKPKPAPAPAPKAKPSGKKH